MLWHDALLRLLQKERYLWKEGLLHLIADLHLRVGAYDSSAFALSAGVGTRARGIDHSSGRSSAVSSNQDRRGVPLEEDSGRLVSLSCEAMRRSPIANDYPSDVGTFQKVFRYISSRYLRSTGPVFFMPGIVRLGDPFSLHFFEPRYRLLISEVMAPYHVRFRRGEPICLDSQHRQFPRFIYANHSPLQPTTPACIVEVRQCLIHPNGTADVHLTPTAYIWLERVWERLNSGGLAVARAIRMGKSASRALEESAIASQRRRTSVESLRNGLGGFMMEAALMQDIIAGGAPIGNAGEIIEIDDDTDE